MGGENLHLTHSILEWRKGASRNGRLHVSAVSAVFRASARYFRPLLAYYRRLRSSPPTGVTECWKSVGVIAWRRLPTLRFGLYANVTRKFELQIYVVKYTYLKDGKGVRMTISR